MTKCENDVLDTRKLACNLGSEYCGSPCSHKESLLTARSRRVSPVLSFGADGDESRDAHTLSVFAFNALTSTAVGHGCGGANTLSVPLLLLLVPVSVVEETPLLTDALEGR
jgi:hypothetical protein